MPPTAAEAMAARFRAARAGPDEAVLEGFHALKHALRFGADVRLVAASRKASGGGLRCRQAAPATGSARSADGRADRLHGPCRGSRAHAR